MAASSVSKPAQSNLFNNHYRYRPTTVDQKRILPRAQTGYARPSTVDDDKLQKLSDATSLLYEDGSHSASPTDDVELKNDPNDLNDKQNNKQEYEKTMNKNKLESSSEFELDILDDEKWSTDIEEEVKYLHIDSSLVVIASEANSRKNSAKTDTKTNKYSNNETKVRSSSISKEPFRFSKHVPARSVSAAKSLAPSQSVDFGIKRLDSKEPDRNNQFELENYESKLNINDDKETKEFDYDNFDDEFFERSENEIVQNGNREFNLLKNIVDDTDLDNLSFCSDDTVDLMQEAKYYMSKKDELEEFEKILKTSSKYNSKLSSSSMNIKMSSSRANFGKKSFDKIEEEKPRDFSCEAVYLENCRKQKTIPVSYFLRHINDQVLVLKHHGLGLPGIRPVSAALMNNSIVTKLDLSDNWLGPEGAEYISKMLKENCFITDLNLSENNMSFKGVETLKEVLKSNNSITHLTLRGNKFDDASAAAWAEIISNTIRIEYLDLSHNNFGEESGKILGAAIGENISIKKLILSWNNIRRKGALGIAKGLAANSVLRSFEIGWNGLSQDGCKALMKTLKENETLEELDLSNNRIATEGAVYIAKGLMTNQTLRILKMGLNPMESAGCFSIIKALQKNLNTKIESLDFSEIIVDKYFNDEFKNFQTAFPHINVKTGCDGISLKPKIKINPILKLRNFIDKHHIKLIDFFNKFDKDGSMAVTREEFRNGILELGVRFTQEEIDQLINELDPDGDGEINYRVLMNPKNSRQKN
ncbi:unnamed protein product [Brachionus calyciflorus]|uniref:EF-hand domain-containing protein n=1 Tax=Brachionus calyciflorus TaxID=104777 RepID=A0A813YAQ4_9BILA|nr:unnamed protein product [Brachionus calyciflorus]